MEFKLPPHKPHTPQGKTHHQLGVWHKLVDKTAGLGWQNGLAPEMFSLNILVGKWHRV
jgi:hypothetical protein